MADSEKVSSLPSERERFEAHLLRKQEGIKGMGSDWPIWKNPDGSYVYSQAEWEAWQAASAGRQELLQALKDAEQEIVWWADNHGCCGGHEEEALSKIGTAIAKHGG